MLLVCSMITPTVFKTLESAYEEFCCNEHPVYDEQISFAGESFTAM